LEEVEVEEGEEDLGQETEGLAMGTVVSGMKDSEAQEWVGVVLGVPWGTGGVLMGVTVWGATVRWAKGGGGSKYPFFVNLFCLC